MQGNDVNEALFSGETLNTPSLLCVEDVLDALAWVLQEGGCKLSKKSPRKAYVWSELVASSSWAASICSMVCCVST